MSINNKLFKVQINKKSRRMNQLPIEIYGTSIDWNNVITETKLCLMSEEIEDISDVNKNENVKEVVEDIINTIIDNIENHNFEYVYSPVIPKKKNIFKKLFNAAKNIFH